MNQSLPFLKTFLVLLAWSWGISRIVTGEESIANVIDGWHRLQQDFNEYQVEWKLRLRQGNDLFAQHQSKWAASSVDERKTWDDFNYRLAVSGQRYRFESYRWACGPHLRDVVTNDLIERDPIQYDLYLGSIAQRGFDHEFSSNLYDRYRREDVDLRSPQPFVRFADRDGLTDYWSKTSTQFPRVTIRERPIPGSVVWARLTPEIDWSDQVDTLAMFAAQIAFGRLDCPGISVDQHALTMRTEPQIVDGHACLVIDEYAAADRRNYRTFCVDPEIGYRIRRFQSTCLIEHSIDNAQRVGARPARFDKTQVDIRYSESENQLPISWSVQAATPHLYPLFAFGRYEVVNVRQSQVTTQSKNAQTEPTTPYVAWVIDERRNEQYIVRRDRSKRMISPAESKLFPRFEDLLGSETHDLVLNPWFCSASIRSILFWAGVTVFGFAVSRRFPRKRKIKRLSIN